MRLNLSGLMLAGLFAFCAAAAADDVPKVKLVTQELPLGTAELQLVPGTVTASPDGKRLALVAKRGNGWLVIVDGVSVGKEYDGIGARSLLFSPDSKRLAYAALIGNNWMTVVDGAEGAACEELRDITFSPDSRRVAYFANKGRSWSAVVDGVVGKEYDSGGGIVFSPDSRRVAFAANRGNHWLIVLDSVEEKEYDGCGCIVFSPDSKRLAYSVNHGRSWLVVVDGAEGKTYDALGRGGFLNPLRETYAALGVNPEALGIEDVIGENGPVFSPDSAHLAYWAKRGDSWRVVVDETESKEYDGFLRGSNLVFDSPKNLHALAVLGTDAVRVDLEVVKP